MNDDELIVFYTDAGTRELQLSEVDIENADFRHFQFCSNASLAITINRIVQAYNSDDPIIRVWAGERLYQLWLVLKSREVWN